METATSHMSLFGDSYPRPRPTRVSHPSQGHVLEGDTAPLLSQSWGTRHSPPAPAGLRPRGHCGTHLAAPTAHDAAAGLPVLEGPLELYFPRGDSVIQPARQGTKDVLKAMVQGTETGQHACSCSHAVPQSPRDHPGPVSPSRSCQPCTHGERSGSAKRRRAAGLCPLAPASAQPLPEVGVDVDVVHALHGADVAAVAHGRVAADAVEANGVRVVQPPPLADPGLLREAAGNGGSLQLRDLRRAGGRTGVRQGRWQTWQDTRPRRDAPCRRAGAAQQDRQRGVGSAGWARAAPCSLCCPLPGAGAAPGRAARPCWCPAPCPVLTLSRYSCSGMACTALIALSISSTRSSLSSSRETSLLLALARTE